MTNINAIFWLSILLMLSVKTLPAQSGGNFQIERSVIAGGGSSLSGGAFTLDGTVGQAAAGGPMTASGLRLDSGFWTPAALIPTSAGVSISGRIMTPELAGLRNARVTLTYQSGSIRSVTTGAFGYYRFDDVEAGQTVVLNVQSRSYSFSPRIVTVFDEIGNLDFIAIGPSSMDSRPKN